MPSTGRTTFSWSHGMRTVSAILVSVGTEGSLMNENNERGKCAREENPDARGAGEGNRTLVVSLGSFCSTIELHPQRRNCSEIRSQPSTELAAICARAGVVPG